MSASTATTDTSLRQAWLHRKRSQVGRLAPRGLDILFQVWLSAPHARLASRLGGFATNPHE
ncbi:MAG: hypothetical protein KF682_16305 [Nitrospira sp.]|nr:hypothetical protein [Nitrospira sp.]